MSDLEAVRAEARDEAPDAAEEPGEGSAADAEGAREEPEEAREEAGSAAGDDAEAAPEGEDDRAGEDAPEEGADGGGAPAPRLGPGEELDDETLLRETAALLHAAPDALSLNRLVELLRRPARARVRGALAALQARFEEAGLPLRVVEIAGAWRILTDPDLGEVVARLAKVQRPEKVTPAGLETLAIVAYRQPVTKAEVEAIRGVQSGSMLRHLVDRRLIRVTGRAEQPGAPLQYGTTREFLDRFGLASLKDLPRDAELARD